MARAVSRAVMRPRLRKVRRARVRRAKSLTASPKSQAGEVCGHNCCRNVRCRLSAVRLELRFRCVFGRSSFTSKNRVRPFWFLLVN